MYYAASMTYISEPQITHFDIFINFNRVLSYIDTESILLIFFLSINNLRFRNMNQTLLDTIPD